MSESEPLKLLSVVIPACDEQGCIASTVEHRTWNSACTTSPTKSSSWTTAAATTPGKFC